MNLQNTTRDRERQQQQSTRTKKMHRRRRNSGVLSRRGQPWELALLSLLTTAIPSANAQLRPPQTTQQTCDYTQDTCHYQFDGECDAPQYCSGTNADCFDCDTCREFSYDCSSCVANGCYYCPGDALCASMPLGNSVWSLHPHRQPSCRAETDWQQQCSTDTAGNIWTDPLYDAMKWSYQLINVEPVWEQGLTGQGIHVRVNDDGVDAEHPEFADNFDVEHSCTSYLPNDYETDTHGTGCASLIAGAKNNGHCAAGIAPDVTLSACNGPSSLSGATDIFLTHLDQVDIISNSWGPLPCENKLTPERRRLQQCPFDRNHPESPCNQCGESFAGALSQSCEKAITDYCSSTYENDPVACGEYLDLYVSCRFHTMSQSNEEGFAKVIAEGRGGLGPIITFAGGNDYKIGVDANGDGMVNSRYTIAVGAVGKDGLHASYSTTGAAILVAAPGGDEEALSNNIVANPGGGCHDITVGTSFATPVVSAVAALMLQANPGLSWRDVQGILALTSQRVDFEDSSWYTNKAGISHSYKYGFGLIDAYAAVTLAQSWENWGAEKQIMAESGVVDVTIPDNVESPNGALAVLTITEEDVVAAAGDKSIAMESVVVYLDLKHGSRGDLQIVLTSPKGTKSILAPSKRPENKILGEDQRWKLMTLRNWGESPIGTWALEIADEKEGHISDCINMDWEYVLDGTRYNCGDLEESGVTDCKSPSQVPFALMQGTFNGLKIEDTCCVCGGGYDAAGIDQRLQSWRMIAYGHIIPETIAPSTLAPTSQAPTVRATQTPGAATPAPTPPGVSCTSQNDTIVAGDSGALDLVVPEGTEGMIVSTMTLIESRNLTVDNTEVVLDLTHPSRGDLRVSLKTPGGKDIMLAPGNRVASQQVPSGQPWTFWTCEASGEQPPGDWTLSVLDLNPGIQSDCIDSAWQVTLENTSYQCSTFADATSCTDEVNQAVALSEFEQRTALDSCCVCGGGTDMTKVTNMLKSWSMNLYSKTNTPPATPPPTVAGNSSIPVAIPVAPGSPAPGSLPPAAGSSAPGVGSPAAGSPPPAAGSPPPAAGSPAPGVGSPVPATVLPTPSPTSPGNATTASGPLERAVVMTLPPDMANRPFMTSGNTTESGAREMPTMTKYSLLSLGVNLAVPYLLMATSEFLM